MALVKVRSVTIMTAGRLNEKLDTNQHALREALERYFLQEDSGSHFETFGGGGDSLRTKNVITPYDILSLSCMGMAIKARPMLRLLEGDEGPKMTTLLAQVPSDIDLTGAPVSVLAQGSAAWKAWDVLRKAGYGPTGTSKLLARKRPRLIPVLDSVVRCAMGLPAAPKDDWKWAWDVWNDPDFDVAAEVGAIQDAAIGHPDIARLSLLRVLDIVV
jgi:hypothetical protein